MLIILVECNKYRVPNHPEESENHLVTGYINDDYSVSSNLSLTNINTGEVVLTPMPRRIMTNSALQNIRLIKPREVICIIGNIIVLFDYCFKMVLCNYLNIICLMRINFVCFATRIIMR